MSAGEPRRVGCPQCGGALELYGGHKVRSVVCPFCGSDHLVIGHDQTLYVTIPERVQDQLTLREAVLEVEAGLTTLGLPVKKLQVWAGGVGSYTTRLEALPGITGLVALLGKTAVSRPSSIVTRPRRGPERALCSGPTCPVRTSRSAPRVSAPRIARAIRGGP